MLFSTLDTRASRLIRLLGLGLVSWSVLGAGSYGPGTSGRGLVVLILYLICLAGALVWMWPGADGPRVPPAAFALVAAGGLLTGASPDSAASAFAFVGVVWAGVRGGSRGALSAAGLGALALAVAVLVYDRGALTVLAYGLGFAAAGLGGANARQTRERAADLELLLAQQQRSTEEALRSARLQESTRIAREIHDVLAHALAGLTIQLEATTALLEGGADRDEVLARVRRAHGLAREGLQETRRAVGALRGQAPAPAAALAALAAEAGAALTVDGELDGLDPTRGHVVVRVVQESLTNVVKHAPGAPTRIDVAVGEDDVRVQVVNQRAAVPVVAGTLPASGGGFGVAGMRERAQALGGTLQAGPDGDGWRVCLRVPLREGAA